MKKRSGRREAPLRKPTQVVTHRQRSKPVSVPELKAKLAAIDSVQGRIEFALDGTITQANDQFLRAVGYTLDEVRGKHHRIFMSPADAHKPEYRAFWDALSRGEPQSGMFRRVTKDGEEIWLQASYNPIFDADGKPFTVRYDAVNAMLLNEFLKEHQTVQELKTTVARQQNQIKALTAGLEKVSAQLEVNGTSRVVENRY